MDRVIGKIDNIVWMCRTVEVGESTDPTAYFILVGAYMFNWGGKGVVSRKGKI